MTRTRHPSCAAVSFCNARLRDHDSGEERTGSVRLAADRIAAVGTPPRVGDQVIDVRGDRLLPGLINAHDHLQLNSLTLFESGDYYRHAREWVTHVDARRRADPVFAAGVAVAREHRLAIGGIKNLLSGVTTVAHHDPFYPCLAEAAFPTGVLQRYGWSHSLYIDGEAAVQGAYRRTPAEWPWIIHAAEGLGAEAAEEFERLDALGCLGANSVLVHGIALDRAQRRRLHGAGAGLIWCPSSNLRLFGTTVDAADLIAGGRVALGTDSRLSGARDLLEELQVAGSLGVDEATLELLVTAHSARLLRLSDRGVLRAGARADILILAAGVSLAAATRADVRLVMVNGIMRYGDVHYAAMLAQPGAWVHVTVDGTPKVLERQLAMRLAQNPAKERGLELPALCSAA